MSGAIVLTTGFQGTDTSGALFALLWRMRIFSTAEWVVWLSVVGVLVALQWVICAYTGPFWFL